MDYAPFWLRVAARTIDLLLVALPIALGFEWAMSRSGAAGWIWVIPLNVAMCGYFVVCHALGGQTLGKALCGLRVVRADGAPAGWRGAVMRSLVTAIACVLWACALMLAIAHLTPADTQVPWHRYTAMLVSHAPDWYRAPKLAYSLWALADVVVLAISSRRRSLHDLVGGTAVIRVRGRAAPVAV